ncbi:hypothetical protein MLD38_018642 [Melastoma candidum]|uniref:Uncharacterized protein n=1 Tax=Melastoma candidum TaxID=119954 RepID=A0ACB9QUE9_9MYRT|nr:hypothetical protein MLD38_018642 [Melastoma candidum]
MRGVFWSILLGMRRMILISVLVADPKLAERIKNFLHYCGILSLIPQNFLHYCAASINIRKVNKPRVRHTRPSISSGSAKSLCRGSYRDVHSFMKRPPRPRVNLARLGTKSLWRYCKHYKLADAFRDSCD